MTRPKLSWLQHLFGDDILTRQHFVFSENHVICFIYKSRDFAYLCDFVTKFGYAVTQDLLARSKRQYLSTFPCVEFNKV